MKVASRFVDSGDGVGVSVGVGDVEEKAAVVVDEVNGLVAEVEDREAPEPELNDDDVEDGVLICIDDDVPFAVAGSGTKSVAVPFATTSPVKGSNDEVGITVIVSVVVEVLPGNPTVTDAYGTSVVDSPGTPTPAGPKLKSSASTTTVDGEEPGPIVYVEPSRKAWLFPTVTLMPLASTATYEETGTMVGLLVVTIPPVEVEEMVEEASKEEYSAAPKQPQTPQYFVVTCWAEMVVMAMVRRERNTPFPRPMTPIQIEITKGNAANRKENMCPTNIKEGGF